MNWSLPSFPNLLLITYGFVTLLLTATGLYYGLLAVERILRSPAEPDTTQADLDDHPTVTIQVPVYNEQHVIDRLLHALGELRWPSSKLHVQIIDDSTDRTTSLIESELPELRDRGIDVEHIVREERTGYKAGAIQRGLRTASGEFVAIFDADFVPDPSFLEETIPHFENPQVGCVQTRWAHLNETYSWFTRAQALALDAHFAVEQWVRARVGSLMSFNATSCVWRRETLAAVGGWSSETVAEDLDLTATALCSGWEFVYTEGYAVPCEIPPTLDGFVRQQTRWARGSAQNVRKHLRGILRTEVLSPCAKFHSVLHVLHYLFYPLLLVWIGLHIAVTAVSVPPRWLLLAGFLGTTPGPLAFLLLGQLQAKRQRIGRRLLAVIPLTLVGIGLAWRITRAVVSGFREMGGSFDRTPKFRLDGPRRSWRGQAYAGTLNTLPEFLLGLGCALGAGLAYVTGASRMAPSLLFFAASFWSVVGFSLWQQD